MNKTESLKLRGINVENSFITATNYDYGSGSGSGSGSGNENQYDYLLRQESIQAQSYYDYYEINCPSETRLLQIRFTPSGSNCPRVTVTRDNSQVGEGFCNEAINIRVRASESKNFRIYLSDRYASGTIHVACYTCECAL